MELVVSLAILDNAQFIIYFVSNIQSCSNFLSTSPSTNPACTASCNSNEFEYTAHICKRCNDATYGYGQYCNRCTNAKCYVNFI